MWLNTRTTCYKSYQIVQFGFLLSRAELSLLTALSIACTHAGARYPAPTHAVEWVGRGEKGADNTEMAPFPIKTYTRDHRPASFLHVNALFSHLLAGEKPHRCGRPVLGYTIPAICIPPAAGLAQECVL